MEIAHQWTIDDMQDAHDFLDAVEAAQPTAKE